MNISTAYVKVKHTETFKALMSMLANNNITEFIKNDKEISDGKPDIIIADVDFISGLYKIIKKLRNGNCFIPILAVAGESDTIDNLPDCITDIIYMPINKTEWEFRLKTYVEIRKNELVKLSTDIINQVFDSFFKEFSVPAHMVNSNLEIVKTNKRLLELTGKKQEDIIGKKCYEIYQNKKEICDNCSVIKALKNKTIVTEKNSYIFKEDKKYFEKSAFPLFNQQNEVEFIIETAKEITDEVKKQFNIKQGDENYRKFIEKSADLIVLFNREGKIRLVNKQVENYGYQINEVLNTSILSYIAKDNIEKTRKLLSDLFDGKTESASYENDILTKDGTKISIISNNEIIRYNDEDLDLAILKDISQLKNIEKQLRNNAETLNNIFNNTVVGIYVQEKDGTFLDVNNAAVNMYGFSNKSQMIGKNPSIISDDSKNNLEEVKRYIELAFRGQSQSFVFWGKKVDGTTFPKYVTIEKGSYFGKEVVFAYAINITDWIATQKLLEESEEKYKTIFQTSPDAISISKMDSTIIEVNDVFINLFNLDKKQAIGKTPFETGLIFSNTNKIKYIRKISKNGFVKNMSFPITLSNGTIVHTLISSKKTKFSGTDHIITIYKDISPIVKAERKLKEREENYRAIVENIHDGLYIYNGKELNFVNDQLCQITGFTKEEMFKKDVCDFFHPDDRERIKKNTYARLAGENIPTIFSSKILTKSEGTKYGEFMVRKITYHGGIAILGAVRDVTEKVLFNQKLVKAKEKAEESNRLKSAFLNNMNHELRTPMNAIMGFSELMDKAEPDQKSQFAGIIRNSAKQLLSLMDDVLYLSRLQSEKLPIKNNYFSPIQIVNDIVKMFSVNNGRSEVEIIAGNPDDFSNIEIYADESKVRQVITNFTSNAVKHTFEGTIEIGFFIEEKEIEFYVKDTGIGIPKDEQSKIFETFYRGRQSTSAAIRGTGLGLSIAKQIAEQLSGEIHLSSDLGRGSYFSISLPLRGMKSTKPEKQKNIIKKSFKEWDNITVLLAEDDPNSFLFYKIILKKIIKQLGHAWNGKDAVQMVDNNQYDIVLMDIKMPIMDGLKATKIIKAKYPDLPIIAQTAYTSMEEKKNILAAGCDDYIAKPVNKQKLLDILQKYVLK